MNRFRKYLSDAVLRARTGGIRHGFSLRARRLSQEIPSLFIVSLPRTFSSYTYLLTRSALLLQEPKTTTFGEILNYERFPGPKTDHGLPLSWFVRPERESVIFNRTVCFLDRNVEPRGFAYKDVVQPFIIAEWLRARKEYRILRIRRNLADVAIAMLNRKWLYPTQAAKRAEDVESAPRLGVVGA